MEIRVVTLGLDGAGKTTILFKLKQDEFMQPIPTIGKKPDRGGGRNARLLRVLLVPSCFSSLKASMWRRWNTKT